MRVPIAGFISCPHHPSSLSNPDKNVRAGTVADEISGLDEIETYAISENFAAVMRKYADRDFMN